MTEHQRETSTEPQGETSTEPHGKMAMYELFDGARYIVRARRVADLSQRELAEATGLSRATIGRLESGAARVDTATLSMILARAGLRLTVVDADGLEVCPVPVDVLRDHAERRFPGHLDVRPPQDAPSDRVYPRRGRAQPLGWYDQRPSRTRRRGRDGTPLDHPTASGLREARVSAYWQAVAAAEARRGPEPECACFDSCFELTCLPDCPCQCEPDHGTTLASMRPAAAHRFDPDS